MWRRKTTASRFEPNTTMHDYWNDPPEQDEPPECCGEMMEVYDDGSCKCLTCGATVDPPVDIEPALEELPEPEPNYVRQRRWGL